MSKLYNGKSIGDSYGIDFTLEGAKGWVINGCYPFEVLEDNRESDGTMMVTHDYGKTSRVLSGVREITQEECYKSPRSLGGEYE